MKTIATDNTHMVVGLGITGVSCVRYLLSLGKSVEVIDSRQNPPLLTEFRTEFPDVVVHLGMDASVLSRAKTLVMSPGVPLATPEVQQAIAEGVELTSDIELFLAQFTGRVVAITGSNAKSTVTAWLGEALNHSGQTALVAGNIGLPVLDTVAESYDIAVLELSSFQLELVKQVAADVACILNVSEDHMDRYDSMADYVQAKQRIYFGCSAAVYNRQDPLTQPLVPVSTTQINFSLDTPDLSQYGLRSIEGETWLCRGFEQLLRANEVSLKGRHNQSNALAVLAMADAVDNDRVETLRALTEFKGLPFRCETVATINGVTYVNDSKATNVGSTTAALLGLSQEGQANIILLVGGQTKGQDLTGLKHPMLSHCKKVIAFGEEKQLFKKLLASVELCDDLAEAINLAVSEARSGDIVLLSPACASFDQYRSFEHRGQHFNQLVEAIL